MCHTVIKDRYPDFCYIFNVCTHQHLCGSGMIKDRSEKKLYKTRIKRNSSNNKDNAVIL